MERTYYHHNEAEITELLVGRKAVKVTEYSLELDNGAILTFAGHGGGCSCGSGDYDLTELNGVDNIITAVEFISDLSDDYARGEGYKIFVYAANEKINLAEFDGTDGNGYYGTGYSIFVKFPENQG